MRIADADWSDLLLDHYGNILYVDKCIINECVCRPFIQYTQAIRFNGEEGKACIRSSADCNTSTLLWPWHQLMWFGGMQACNSNNYPSQSCRHGKTWLSIRSSLELETESYQKLYNMSGFLFSCSVIYCNMLAWFWHGLASKTLHPKAFLKAFNSRITSQTWIMRGSLSLCITRLYLVIDRRRHVWKFHAETLCLDWNVP